LIWRREALRTTDGFAFEVGRSVGASPLAATGSQNRRGRWGSRRETRGRGAAIAQAEAEGEAERQRADAVTES